MSRFGISHQRFFTSISVRKCDGQVKPAKLKVVERRLFNYFSPDPLTAEEIEGQHSNGADDDELAEEEEEIRDLVQDKHSGRKSLPWSRWPYMRILGRGGGELFCCVVWRIYHSSDQVPFVKIDVFPP